MSANEGKKKGKERREKMEDGRDEWIKAWWVDWCFDVRVNGQSHYI